MAGGAVHRTPYRECVNLAEWGRTHGSYLAARAALSGQDYRQGSASWCFDFVFGAFLEVCLSEQGEEKMKAIDQITDIIGREYNPELNTGLRAVNE